MNKKSSLFGDQSSSSRVQRLKDEAINKVKSAETTKDNREKNSEIEALARVRGGGYIVPPKVKQKKACDSFIPPPDPCEEDGTNC
jgi:hypothetical protein